MVTPGHFIQSVSSIENLGCFENISRLEVELLLSRVLCCKREKLYILWDQKLNGEQIKRFQSLLEQRKAGMPMAYIMGKKEFYGYEFLVAPGVFIPRPETETLVSAVLFQKDPKEKLNIVDMGCGSGCIGLSLLANLPKARLISVDSSEQALQLSIANAKNMDLFSRTCFLNKDISPFGAKDIKKAIGKEVDLIVANPPYIAFDDSTVEEEVVAFEPPTALFSSEKGLYHIRSWLNVAAQLLKPGGDYFFEIGAKQNAFFMNFHLDKMQKKREFKDLSHIVRVIQFQKGNG